MSKIYSFLIPSSPGPSTLFSAALVTNTAQTVTVGFKTIIGITTSGATDAAATTGIHARFGSASKPPTATTADWFIPPNTVQYFELGSEFDRVSLVSSAATPSTYYIYVFSNL